MMNDSSSWHRHLHWILPALGCGLLAWAALTVWRVNVLPGSVKITCSGGAPATSRAELASVLARYAAADGLDIQLVDSAGSEETLQLVDAGAIDVGLVSGGFLQQHYANVRQLATIGTEPLHLLVKSQYVTHLPCDLAILKDRRVNVGAIGSGTHALAIEILEFAGLKAKDEHGRGDYTQSSIGIDELTARARAIGQAPPARAAELVAALPDAVFWLNSLPSHAVQELIAAADYELIPLPFCESFRINGMQHLGNAAHRIDRRQVTKGRIPAFTYRAINGVPAADCETLGVPLIVVARAGLSNQAVDQLVAALYEGPFAGENPPADLLARGSEFPLHSAVTTYLQRRKPVAVRDLVDVMQKLLSVFGAFSAGVLAVLSFYRRRRTKSASSYVSEIGQIERLSWRDAPTADEHSTLIHRERLGQLEEQLVELKQRIIQDYAVGRFTGEAAFANLMTLITDTRQSLKRVRQPSHEIPALRFPQQEEPAQHSPQQPRRRAAA